MKTLPSLQARSTIFVLALTAVTPFPGFAQPSSRLPSSYTYMEAPPPGYPGSTSTPSRASKSPAPAKKSPSPSSYGPLPDSLSLQVARLAANDHTQDSRLSKLERDVSGIKSSSSRSSTASTTSSTPRAHTSYVVRPGDSLWRIASAHRVSPGAIMELNRMKSDVVMLGHTLLIPAPGGATSTQNSTTQVTYKPYYHDVRPGDTSTTISKKYDVSRQALMTANPRVDFGGGLIPGSRIVIPGKSTASTPPKSPSPTKTAAGGTYTVRSGDSLKAIAIKHGTTTANLAALNGIKNPDKLLVGQHIVLPGGKAPSNTRQIASTAPKSPSVPKYTPSPASSDTVPLPGMGLAPAVPPTPPSTPAPTPPPAASDIHRGVLAYRVDATDSIESIANQFSTTPQRIREMNHLPATTKLASGDEIMVPAMGAVAVSR